MTIKYSLFGVSGTLWLGMRTRLTHWLKSRFAVRTQNKKLHAGKRFGYGLFRRCVYGSTYIHMYMCLHILYADNRWGDHRANLCASVYQQQCIKAYDLSLYICAEMRSSEQQQQRRHGRPASRFSVSMCMCVCCLYVYTCEHARHDAQLFGAIK